MDRYLQHYGILGQKWGVRRYENEDGTLTEAGKKRYANRQSEIKRLGEAIPKAKKLQKKYEKELADLEKNGIKSKYYDLKDDNDLYNSGYDSHEKALEEYKNYTKKNISLEKSWAKEYEHKIKDLKNARISDETYLEASVLAGRRAMADWMIGTAGSIALSTIAAKKGFISTGQAIGYSILGSFGSLYFGAINGQYKHMTKYNRRYYDDYE